MHEASSPTPTRARRRKVLSGLLAAALGLGTLSAVILPAAAANAAPALFTCTPEQQRASERWWYFGNGAGIDFGASGTTATAFAQSPVQSTVEGNTVVSDSAGSLQFLSNGLQIFDRTNNVMANGSGLLGQSSSTQTTVSFPLVNQPGKYVVVANSAEVNTTATGFLTYSIVDMALNGGFGDVESGQKNLALGGQVSGENVTAVPDSTGTGYWVLTATPGTSDVVAFRFDGNGYVGPPVTSSVGSSIGAKPLGTLKLSPDGSEILLNAGSTILSPPWVDQPTLIKVMNFDAATGVLTMKYEFPGPSINPGNGMAGYSADFTQSGDFVYVSVINPLGLAIPKGAAIYRYQLAGQATSVAVAATETLVWSNPTALGGAVQRGPDGRMYAADALSSSLVVINTPDSPTVAGAGVATFPLVGPSFSWFGLPQQVTGCANVDFGDAPDTYGTALAVDGARHSAVAGLSLGLITDAEADGVPTVLADGDDLVGPAGNDEDSVANPIEMTNGAATVVSVIATNSTATDARLVGWLDLDGNGVFDPATEESAVVTVPAGAGSASYDVTFPTSATVPASTFARFRLYGNPASTISPTGGGAIGEVEDYTAVALREFTVEKTADVSVIKPGEVITYSVSVTNTGSFAYTLADPATFTDNFADVLDDADYNNDVATDGVPGGGTYIAGVLTWSGALALGETKVVTYSFTAGTAGTGDAELVNKVTTGPDGNCLRGIGEGCSVTGDLVDPFFVVTKSADNPTLRVGDRVTYTITIENTGTGTGTGTFVDPVPTIVKADGATCASTTPGGTCAATLTGNTVIGSASLPAGGKTTITVTGILASAGSATNVVDFTETNCIANCQNLTARAEIMVAMKLANTGTPIVTTSLIGVLVLLAGAGLTVAARRRRAMGTI